MNIQKVYYRVEESEEENNGSKDVVVGTIETPALDVVVTKQGWASVEDEIKEKEEDEENHK